MAQELALKNQTVAVGMSGGVDSSVTALLLKKAGFHVVGLFMKNWEEEGSVCSAERDYEDVLRVCAQIDIPCYPVNFAKEYWDHVFTRFLDELKKGYTPNPDVLCNREIKFQFLLEKALSLGASALATGHYAQTKKVKGEKGEHYLLLRAKDTNKDQTYFLSALKQSQLQKALFPIGHLTKQEVRKIAEEASLATAKKRDSVGICFIGKRDFSSFLKQYIPYQEGVFETVEGKVVGRHKGVAYYTIGQRKGLEIGGPGAAWFVVDKIVERNVVVIAQGEDHPALYAKALLATEPSWIQDVEAPTFPLRCTAKIRYRQQDSACTVIQTSKKGAPEELLILFDTPQRAITPRQCVVFYQGEECLGSAWIRCVSKDETEEKPFSSLNEHSIKRDMAG